MDEFSECALWFEYLDELTKYTPCDPDQVITDVIASAMADEKIYATLKLFHEEKKDVYDKFDYFWSLRGTAHGAKWYMRLPIPILPWSKLEKMLFIKKLKVLHNVDFWLDAIDELQGYFCTDVHSFITEVLSAAMASEATADMLQMFCEETTIAVRSEILLDLFAMLPRNDYYRLEKKS